MFKQIKRLWEIKKQSKKNSKKFILFDEKERAIIDVGAENYDDIFSPFCLYDMNVLDFELEDYLDNKNEFIPLGYDLRVVFYITDANEEKRKEIESTVKQNYDTRVESINKKLKRNTWFSCIMLVSGIITLLLNYWLTNIHGNLLLTSIMEMASWVFTWTAVDAFFLERKVLQMEKMLVYRLAKANIEVKDFVPKWAKQPQTPPAAPVVVITQLPAQTNNPPSPPSTQAKTN